MLSLVRPEQHVAGAFAWLWFFCFSQYFYRDTDSQPVDSIHFWNRDALFQKPLELFKYHLFCSDYCAHLLASRSAAESGLRIAMLLRRVAAIRARSESRAAHHYFQSDDGYAPRPSPGGQQRQCRCGLRLSNHRWFPASKPG